MTGPAVDMTDPNRERIRRNLARLSARGASPDVVQRYLRDVEGISDVQAQFLNVESGSSSTAPGPAETTSQGGRIPLDVPRDAPGLPTDRKFGRVGFGAEPEMLRSLGQGASFGFGDEITARVRSLSPNQTYEGALADERQKLEGERDASRVASLGTEAAGMALTGKALGAGNLIQKATTLPRRIAAGAAEGAAAGGLYGAGAAGEGERVQGAVVGGGVGATVGAALPALGAGVRATADALGIRGAMNPQARAERAITDAIRKSGTTPGQLADDIERRAAQSGAAPEVLADQSENLLGLSRAAQARPSTAKDRVAATLVERAKQQGARLVNALETWSGTQVGNVRQTADALMNRQRTNAAKLYQEAFKDTRPITDPELESLLRVPYMQEAIAKARHLVTRRGEAFDEVFTNVPSRAARARSALGMGDTPDAVMEVYRPPTIQTMDRVKKGLDELIATASGKAGKEGLGPEALRDVTILKRRLVDILDRANPKYAQARAVFAGDAAMQDALAEGGMILKRDPREAAEVYASMTPGEQSVFRQGAIHAFRRLMEQTRGAGSAADRLAATAENLQRVKVLFQGRPIEEDRFLQMLERELRMSQSTRQGLGNSVTARLQQETRDLATNEPILGQMAQERSVRGPLVQRLLDPLNARLQGVHGSTADALAPMLTAGAQTPADLVALLRRLQAPAVRAAAQAQRGAATSTATAGLTASRVVPSPPLLLPPMPVTADATASR